MAIGIYVEGGFEALYQAGWVREPFGLYFYASRGRETHLKATWQVMDNIDTIHFRLFGTDMGKVYDITTGQFDSSLWERKVDWSTALELSQAMKPIKTYR